MPAVGVAQVFTHATLVILGNNSPLQLITFVQEGDAEGEGHITKDFAFCAQVSTVLGDITVDTSPFTKPLRVRSATLTMLAIMRLPSSL